MTLNWILKFRIAIKQIDHGENRELGNKYVLIKTEVA
jgi:hypothetical protein